MNKLFFSIKSGEIYSLNEKYTYHLDCCQLEITNYPKKNCKKCFGRGYNSKNTKTGHFNLCSCCLRDADATFLRLNADKQIEDVILNTKKDDSFLVTDNSW